MPLSAWDAAATQCSAAGQTTELFDTAPEAMVGTDAEGRIVAANQAAVQLFGYSAGELCSMRFEELVPNGGVARRRGGGEVTVEVTSSDPGPRGVAVAVIRDRPVHSSCECILESLAEAVFALDREWRYAFVNHRAAQMLGRRREELIGRSIWDEFPDLLNTVFYQEYHRAASERRPVEFSAFDAVRQLWVEVHVCPYEHGLSILFRDLAGHDAYDSPGVQSQRMEALGRLAGGVAHDFNNLLTIIGGYGRMLLDRLETKHPMRKDVEPIVEAAVRASTLTRQLLSFSRRQFVQPRVVDLNRLIAKMNKMLRRVIGEDIELHLSLRPDLGRTAADPGQLEQVIMNLAVNARDAMPRGGRLNVVTDNVEIVEANSGLAPGNYVSLTISDTGGGMDPETRAHVFEPFFTTKAKGKGTGLGLATVYGIVKQAGGDIQVESEPDRGALFRILLPRTHKSGKARHGVPARRPRKGHETILLVEDEPDVRKLTREMLTRLGYTVYDAGDGAEALSVWKSISGAVDLLVTDVVMPRMSGHELAEKLCEERPGLKVLYVSGYTDEAIARHGVAENAALLPKPFSRETLGLKVRGVLDAAPARAAAH